MDALKQAATYVYEPVNAFELTVPEQAISTAMYKLAPFQQLLQSLYSITILIS